MLPSVEFVLSYNKGISFSFLQFAGDAQRWPLIGLSVLAAGLLGCWLSRVPSGKPILAIGLALIVGGALGNLLDRAPDRGGGRLRPSFLWGLVVRRIRSRRCGHHNGRHRDVIIHIFGARYRREQLEAAASASRASGRMRSTMARRPLERCGMRCSRKPNSSKTAGASDDKISGGVRRIQREQDGDQAADDMGVAVTDSSGAVRRRCPVDLPGEPDLAGAAVDLVGGGVSASGIGSSVRPSSMTYR